MRVYAIFDFNLLCLVKPYIYPKSKIWHSLSWIFKLNFFPIFSYLGCVSFIPAFLSYLHVYFSRSFAPSPPLVSVTFLLHFPVLWWEGPSLGVNTGGRVATSYTNHKLAMPCLVPFGVVGMEEGRRPSPLLKKRCPKKTSRRNIFQTLGIIVLSCRGGS